MGLRDNKESCGFTPLVVLRDNEGSYPEEVALLERSMRGLVMPTFNRELAALTDEAMDLEPTEDEA